MIKRDSNIELLRIVCMLLIVFQHCIHLCAFPEIWDTAVMSPEVCVASVLVGLTYIGVNCFVLISGYYGIKLKLRSALNIYLICAFYALIGYLLHLYIDGAHVGMGLLYHSIFCISHSKLWFVKCYAGLMLLSPILNAAMDGMSKKTYQWVIGLLTVLNVYFGFIWRDAVFNADGYTIANFVYIYMIGGYIRRYVDVEWICAHQNANACLYLITSLLWAGSILLQRYIETPWYEWGYNNPLTLVGAVCFFMLFVSIPKFYNKSINWLASGTFAVYVVHSGDYFDGWFRLYIGKLAEWLHTEFGIIVTIAGMLLVSISLLVGICTIEKIRQIILLPLIDIKKSMAYVYAKWSNYCYRKRLWNDNFTIITNSCIGGVMYHKLGKKFLSPTINLWMEDEDFYRFVQKLDWYLTQPLKFVKGAETTPVAYCGDVLIHFNHYKTEIEAETKWNERKIRIAKDNLYIICSDRPKDASITHEDMLSLKDIPCRGKVVFSVRKYDDIDYIVPLPRDPNGYYVNSYMFDKSKYFQRYRWEKAFDWVHWLNTGEVKVKSLKVRVKR